MICSLHGTARKGELPLLTIEVGGVGYEVQCANDVWEIAKDGEEMTLHTFTFVREDRLELFGFTDARERKLFTHFLAVAGVGPRTALQLCSVPANILCHAVENSDTRSLSSLKGIGKKMAEKLLLELESMMEKGVLAPSSGTKGAVASAIDEDALEALTNLGYDRRSMLKHLQEVKDAKTTEERVKRVLQML